MVDFENTDYVLIDYNNKIFKNMALLTIFFKPINFLKQAKIGNNPKENQNQNLHLHSTSAKLKEQ